MFVMAVKKDTSDGRTSYHRADCDTDCSRNHNNDSCASCAHHWNWEYVK